MANFRACSSLAHTDGSADWRVVAQIQKRYNVQHGRVCGTTSRSPRILPYIHVPRVLFARCACQLDHIIRRNVLGETDHIAITGVVDIDPKNVNILDGNAPDLVRECNEYEAKIEAVGGIELFLGGIGEDGHIAFNEPGSSLSSRTRIKTLAYDTILANARFFGDDIAAVPRMALTVGVKTVLESREVAVVVTGQRKALALSMAIEHGVNHLWTLSALQTHPWALIVVDEDATAGTGTCARERDMLITIYPELRVKTVKYFKSIERVHEEVEVCQEKLAKKERAELNGNGY